MSSAGAGPKRRRWPRGTEKGLSADAREEKFEHRNLPSFVPVICLVAGLHMGYGQERGAYSQNTVMVVRGQEA